LKAKGDLEQAYELSKPKESVFEESLFAVKREIQKAWSFVNEGYNGNEELLKTMKIVSNIAKDLLSKMEEINRNAK
jgi:hypothetical protein